MVRTEGIGLTTCWSGTTSEGVYFPIEEVRQMSADIVHAAFGVAFTSIWLMVGQILISDR